MTIPSCDEAARAVIAGCLVNQEFAQRAVELLKPEDFTESSLGDWYAPVFEAIASLVNAGKRSVPVMVAREVDRLKLTVPTTSSLSRYLSEVMREYTPGVQADVYCNVMAEYGYRRRLRVSGLERAELAGRFDLNLDELEAEKERIDSTVNAKNVTTDKPTRLGDVIRNELDIQRNRKRGEFTGIKTGFPAVDAILMGMDSGDFIVWAGRPAMGKTAFAFECGANIAKSGKSVGFVSIEMEDGQLAKRSIASEGGVSGELMRAGMVEQLHWDSVSRRLEDSGLMSANFFLVDNINTYPQIRKWAWRVKREFGLDILFIDYLQLVKPGDRYKGNRVNEVGEVSHALKALAKELGIPVVALSQLSRTLETRSEKEGGQRPQLSDLRETGDIEQDADTVGFLYRDEYYHPDTSDKGMAEFIVGKHRNGPVGTATLGFIKERTKFTNLDKRHA